MKQKKDSSSWPKVRKLFNDIHLWLGLISGIVVFIVCLSGTIYVFNTEIREFSQSELYTVKPAPGAAKLSPEALMASVSKEAGGKVISIKISSDPNRSYLIGVKKDEGQAPGENRRSEGGKEQDNKSEGRSNGDRKQPESAGSARSGERGGPPAPGGGPQVNRGTQYLVDPYTGKILGTNQEKNATIDFMTSMFSLHRWLLLDKFEEPLIGELPNRTLGSIISGTATILFTIGVITGIIIWFPQRIKNWKQGLKVKWNANWKRINHDLHNSLGFYSCILLFLMGVTGPYFSYTWYRDGLRKTLGTYQSPDASKPETPKSDLTKTNSSEALLLTDYIKAADLQLNYIGDHTITLPADSADVITISKTKTGFFAPVAPDKIVLDQYTASVLQTDIFKDKPFNERVSGSVKSLHLGDVYGTFSKILYFFACLIATSLPVTGVLIWLNKLKKKKPVSSSKFRINEVQLNG